MKFNLISFRKSHKHSKSKSHHRTADSSSESSDSDEAVKVVSKEEFWPRTSPDLPALNSKSTALSKVQQDAAAIVAAAAAAISEDDSDDIDIVDEFLEGSLDSKSKKDDYQLSGGWGVEDSSQSLDKNNASQVSIEGLMGGRWEKKRGVQLNTNGSTASLTINVTNDKAKMQVN